MTERMIDGRVASGRWQRMHTGVYRVITSPSSWRQTMMGHCLRCDAVASHRAAAVLWRLTGFEQPIHEISAPRGRARASERLPIIHHVDLLPVDVTRADGIPVTTVARTLIDLCSVAPRDAVEDALDDALRRKLVTVARIRWRLEQLAQRGRPGIRVMRELLEQRDPDAAVPDSVFERRLLRELRRSGLPDPVMHHRVRNGGRELVLDLAYPQALVAIEAEGYRWHSGRLSFERDLERRNALTAIGWRIVHVTWTDLTSRPHVFTGRVAMLLGL